MSVNRVNFIICPVIVLLLLSACSTLQTNVNDNNTKHPNYEHALPLLPVGAPTEVVPVHKTALLDDAIEQKSQETLESIGLRKTHSVFIPPNYSNSNNGTLFLNGIVYVSPHGYSSVQGYVKGKNQDLVAVVESRTLQSTDPTLVMAYYFISISGNTSKEIGVIPLGVISNENQINAITTNNAIFTITQADSGISYNGFDINGKRVTGPQNVFDATPLQNRSWLLLRKYNPNFAMIDSNGWKDIGNHAGKDVVAARSTAYYQDINGQNKLLGTTPLYKFLHTQRIIVNQTTVTDSALTDMVWGLAEYKACTTCGNVFATAPFGILLTGQNAEIAQGKGMYIPNGPIKKIEYNNVLANSGSMALNIWQDREFGNWVFINKSKEKNAVYYRVMSWQKGVSLDGSPGWLWGTDTRIAQVIDVPSHLIIYHNRGDSKYYRGFENQGLAIDINTKKFISQNEMLDWLSQYGVAIGRSYSPAA